MFPGYKKLGQQTSQISESHGKSSDAIPVDLELDLMDMILYDAFLGENFIKCLFRYYSFLPDYVKEIFIDKYVEQE